MTHDERIEMAEDFEQAAVQMEQSAKRYYGDNKIYTDFTCNVIEQLDCDASRKHVVEMMKKFKGVFQPANKEYVWWGDNQMKNECPRVLALCFMADMAEMGDLDEL